MTRTRSPCTVNGNRMTVTCHLCDTLVTSREESAEWEVRWLAKCSESLAQLIDIEGFGPAFFDTGHYCSGCMTLIRDVDFSVRASASLTSRLLTLRTQIAAFLISRLSLEAAKADSSGEISQSEVVSHGVLKTEGIEWNFSTASETLNGSVSEGEESGEIATESAVLETVPQTFETPFPTAQAPSTRVLRSRTKVSYRVDAESVGSDRELDEDWSIPKDDQDADWSVPNDADADWSVPNDDDGDWSNENDKETKPMEAVTEGTNPKPNMKRRYRKSVRVENRAIGSKISVEPNSKANGSCPEKVTEGPSPKPNTKRRYTKSVGSGNRGKRTKISVAPNSKPNGSRSAVITKTKLSNMAEKEFIAAMKVRSRYWAAPKELESTLSEFVRKHFEPSIFTGHVTQALLVYLLHSELEEHNQSTKTYICATGACPARFRQLSELRHHQAHAHGEYFDSVPFQCFECPTRFPIAAQLNAHIRKKHEGDGMPHHCEVSGCAATFRGGTGLLDHTRRRHPEFLTELGFGTVRSKYYKYRDTVAMSQEPFRRGRAKGYSIKTGSLTFTCTEPGCTYRTNTERLLEFHIMDRHPSSAQVGSARPYLCDLCGKGFKKRFAYNKHPCANPAPLKCDECGKGFAVPLHLAYHKKLKHAHVQLHKCSVCHRTYARTEDVQRHEKLHNPASGFNCVLTPCSTPTFESVEDLRAHVTGPAHDLTQRALVCDVCGKVVKGVKALDKLKRHRLTHLEGGPFKCRFCGKGHQLKSSQVTHEEINHPDLVEKRIYACKLCDATFTVGQYLHKHTAWHRHGSNACRPIAKKRPLNANL